MNTKNEQCDLIESEREYEKHTHAHARTWCVRSVSKI